MSDDSEEHIWYDESAGEWVLGHDLVVYLPIDSSGLLKRHLIPEGFRSDLGSIKRIFWIFIAPFELGIDSVLVHDFLYRNSIGTRAWADWVFLYLMQQNKISWWRRTTAYYAVRTFGASSWGEN